MMTDCFCGFCKNPRRIYSKKRIGMANVFQSAILSLVLSMAFWQEPDPRMVVIFVFALSLMEVVIIVRRRLSLPCPHCGFDPAIYSSNPEKAAQKVTAFLARKKVDPTLMVTTNAVKLPVKVIPAPNRLNKTV